MSTDPGKDLIRKINALLSFHFKIPYPESLSDEDWSEKWQQLKWVFWFEAQRHETKDGDSINL